MSKNPNNKKKINIIAVFVQLLIGGAIGFAGAHFAVGRLFEDRWTLARLLQFIIFLYIAVFIHINIHEFGHFIFGRLFGYRLISYRVGVFAWNNENGRMRLSIIKNKGYGGLCAMIPPEKAIPVYKEVMFYFGGILFNILSSVFFLSLLYILHSTSEMAELFLITIGGTGLILGIMNFMPFIAHNNATDGKLIWSLLLKDPFARKLKEVNKMTSQLSAGIRPRDMELAPLSDTEQLQAFDLMAILFAYFKALDSSNLEDMQHDIALLEKNLDSFPHPALPSLYYELCYMACISGEADQARIYYEKAGKILQRDRDVNGLRVKAYYEYYINKDPERAAAYCENALAVADKFPIKGQGLMEKDLVKHLKELLSK